MLEGKAVIGETDMLETMQQEALHIAARALDLFDVTEATEIARFIKKVCVQNLALQFLILEYINLDEYMFILVYVMSRIAYQTYILTI